MSFPENGVTMRVMGVTVCFCVAGCALIFMSGMVFFNVFSHVLAQTCEMGAKIIVNVATSRCLATARYEILAVTALLPFMYRALEMVRQSLRRLFLAS